MQKILDQYGNVTIYMEQNHPSPMYHVDGGVEPNPYGNLAVLLGDDNLEEVMYNGGSQCVKVCLLYTSPSPRDQRGSRMPSSA